MHEFDEFTFTKHMMMARKRKSANTRTLLACFLLCTHHMETLGTRIEETTVLCLDSSDMSEIMTRLTRPIRRM